MVGIDPMQEVKDCLVKEGLGLHECTAKFARDSPASGADGLKVRVCVCVCGTCVCVYLHVYLHVYLQVCVYMFSRSAQGAPT